MADTLLILGNGFDKKCGLKSSFFDYYSTLFKSESIENNKIRKLFEFIKNNKFSYDRIELLLKDLISVPETLTIWDIYFFIKLDLTSNNTMWFDVERSIEYSFLDEIVIRNKKYKNYWDYFIEKHYEIYQKLRSEPFYRFSTSMKEELLVYFMYVSKVNSRFKLGEDYNRKIDVLNFYEYLKDQLEIFELNFRNYLKGIVNDEDYKKKQYSNCTKLKLNETNILSFNYTEFNTDMAAKIENVHGTLTNNLSIIGIDGSYLSSNDLSYQFTKTYRKMEQFTRQKSKTVNTILDPEIKTIIFYGHSLNKQDYSYFQSIFDFYNIYGYKNSGSKSDRIKNVKLIFYYSLYEGKEPIIIKKEAFKSIINLIHNYDKTFKSDHEKGNNLLHKLLLENRIELRLFE